MNIREQIFAANDLHTEPITIPEWNVSFFVKEFTAKQKIELFKAVKGTENENELAFRMIILSCVDEAGQKIFTDEDMQKIGDKASTAIEKIVDVINTVNGFVGDDAKKN